MKTNFLGMAAEFEIPGSLVAVGDQLTSNGKYLVETNYVIDIRGSMEEFYELLKAMELKGCNQELISILKKGRDIGVAWAFFKVNG